MTQSGFFFMTEQLQLTTSTLVIFTHTAACCSGGKAALLNDRDQGQIHLWRLWKLSQAFQRKSNQITRLEKNHRSCVQERTDQTKSCLWLWSDSFKLKSQERLMSCSKNKVFVIVGTQRHVTGQNFTVDRGLDSSQRLYSSISCLPS